MSWYHPCIGWLFSIEIIAPQRGDVLFHRFDDPWITDVIPYSDKVYFLDIQNLHLNVTFNQ